MSLLRWSVYHTIPSLPTAGSWGNAPLRGSWYSTTAGPWNAAATMRAMMRFMSWSLRLRALLLVFGVGVQQALNLPLEHQVLFYHLAHDAGDECVPPGIGREPSGPFELVQRFRDLRCVELRDTHEPRCHDGPLEDGDRLQDELRRWAQAPEAHADRRDDPLGQVAGQRLIERLERLGPRSPDLVQIQPRDHGAQQLDHQQREAGGVGAHPAGEAIESRLVETRRRPARQLLDVRSAERREAQHDAVHVTPELRAQVLQLGPRRRTADGAQDEQRTAGQIA